MLTCSLKIPNIEIQYNTEDAKKKKNHDDIMIGYNLYIVIL